MFLRCRDAFWGYLWLVEEQHGHKTWELIWDIMNHTQVLMVLCRNFNAVLIRSESKGNGERGKKKANESLVSDGGHNFKDLGFTL